MKNNPHLQYQRQEIMSASPERLVTKMYDFAIQACHQKDEERLKGILTTLINGLNFDYELSSSLYPLYEYCRRKASDHEFEEVASSISDVRDAWREHVEPQASAKKPKTSNNGGYVV